MDVVVTFVVEKRNINPRSLHSKASGHYVTPPNTGSVLCCLANRGQDVILRKEGKYIVQISRINNAKLNLKIMVERNRNGSIFLRVLMAKHVDFSVR